MSSITNSNAETNPDIFYIHDNESFLRETETDILIDEQVFVAVNQIVNTVSRIIPKPISLASERLTREFQKKHAQLTEQTKKNTTSIYKNIATSVVKHDSNDSKNRKNHKQIKSLASQRKGQVSCNKHKQLKEQTKKNTKSNGEIFTITVDKPDSRVSRSKKGYEKTQKLASKNKVQESHSRDKQLEEKARKNTELKNGNSFASPVVKLDLREVENWKKRERTLGLAAERNVEDEQLEQKGRKNTELSGDNCFSSTVVKSYSRNSKNKKNHEQTQNLGSEKKVQMSHRRDLQLEGKARKNTELNDENGFSTSVLKPYSRDSRNKKNYEHTQSFASERNVEVCHGKDAQLEEKVKNNTKVNDENCYATSVVKPVTRDSKNQKNHEKTQNLKNLHPLNNLNNSNDNFTLKNQTEYTIIDGATLDESEYRLSIENNDEFKDWFINNIDQRSKHAEKSQPTGQSSSKTITTEKISFSNNNKNNKRAASQIFSGETGQLSSKNEKSENRITISCPNDNKKSEAPKSFRDETGLTSSKNEKPENSIDICPNNNKKKSVASTSVREETGQTSSKNEKPENSIEICHNNNNKKSVASTSVREETGQTSSKNEKPENSFEICLKKKSVASTSVREEKGQTSWKNEKPENSIKISCHNNNKSVASTSFSGEKRQTSSKSTMPENCAKLSCANINKCASSISLRAEKDDMKISAPNITNDDSPEVSSSVADRVKARKGRHCKFPVITKFANKEVENFTGRRTTETYEENENYTPKDSNVNNSKRNKSVKEIPQKQKHLGNLKSKLKTAKVNASSSNESSSCSLNNNEGSKSSNMEAVNNHFNHEGGIEKVQLVNVSCSDSLTNSSKARKRSLTEAFNNKITQEDGNELVQPVANEKHEHELELGSNMENKIQQVLLNNNIVTTMILENQQEPPKRLKMEMVMKPEESSLKIKRFTENNALKSFIVRIPEKISNKFYLMLRKRRLIQIRKMELYSNLKIQQMRKKSKETSAKTKCKLSKKRKNSCSLKQRTKNKKEQKTKNSQSKISKDPKFNRTKNNKLVLISRATQTNEKELMPVNNSIGPSVILSDGPNITSETKSNKLNRGLENCTLCEKLKPLKQLCYTMIQESEALHESMNQTWQLLMLTRLEYYFQQLCSKCSASSHENTTTVLNKEKDVLFSSKDNVKDNSYIDSVKPGDSGIENMDLDDDCKIIGESLSEDTNHLKLPMGQQNKILVSSLEKATAGLSKEIEEIFFSKDNVNAVSTLDNVKSADSGTNTDLDDECQVIGESLTEEPNHLKQSMSLQNKTLVTSQEKVVTCLGKETEVIFSCGENANFIPTVDSVKSADSCTQNIDSDDDCKVIDAQPGTNHLRRLNTMYQNRPIPGTSNSFNNNFCNYQNCNPNNNQHASNASNGQLNTMSNMSTSLLPNEYRHFNYNSNGSQMFNPSCWDRTPEFYPNISNLMKNMAQPYMNQYSKVPQQFYGDIRRGSELNNGPELQRNSQFFPQHVQATNQNGMAGNVISSNIYPNYFGASISGSFPVSPEIANLLPANVTPTHKKMRMSNELSNQKSVFQEKPTENYSRTARNATYSSASTSRRILPNEAPRNPYLFNMMHMENNLQKRVTSIPEETISSRSRAAKTYSASNNIDKSMSIDNYSNLSTDSRTLSSVQHKTFNQQVINHSSGSLSERGISLVRRIFLENEPALIRRAKNNQVPEIGNGASVQNFENCNNAPNPNTNAFSSTGLSMPTSLPTIVVTSTVAGRPADRSLQQASTAQVPN